MNETTEKVRHSGEELREIHSKMGGDKFFAYLFEYGMGTSDWAGEQFIAEFFLSDDKYANAAANILTLGGERKISHQKLEESQIISSKARKKRKSKKRDSNKSKKANRRKR